MGIIRKIILKIKHFFRNLFNVRPRKSQKIRLGNYGKIEMDIFRRVNNERRRRKIAHLAWDQDSYRIVKSRAKEIIHDFSHNGCPAGYGENIAKIPVGRVIGLGEVKFHTLGRSFTKTWMKSPGHRQNILDERYIKVAIGIEKRGRWFFAVQLFGT
jgi:uncharacterized protein YkwD